jgi:hypothetical protein
MAKSRSAKKGRRAVSTKPRRAGGSKGATSRSSRSARGKNGAPREDAIALLKSDHREVERMFSEFERARSDERKRELAEQICADLRTHTTIEEEIFYPAFLEATEEKDLHHEAEIEHAGAKHLIGEIESAGPEDDQASFERPLDVPRRPFAAECRRRRKQAPAARRGRRRERGVREIGRERERRAVGERPSCRQRRLAEQRAAGRACRQPRRELAAAQREAVAGALERGLVRLARHGRPVEDSRGAGGFRHGLRHRITVAVAP